jgi:hypothetical protein
VWNFLRRLVEKLVISRVTPTLYTTYAGAPCDSGAASA